MSDINIGNYFIKRVIELEKPFSHAQKFFPDLTDEMLATCQRELPKGQITAAGEHEMSFHAFVVKTGKHVILFDTCCGNDKERPERPAFHKLKTNFMPALAAANVKPEEVDFVMCTHLHWDHVGWNTYLEDGTWKPTFPNAKYIMSKTEYDFWDNAYRTGVKSPHTQAFEDSVQPIERAKQAVLVSDDYELENGIWVEPCHGHTPGTFVINMQSNGQRGVVTGDVIHHQIQLRYPSMSTSADDDKDAARVSRTALIEKLAGSGTILLPGHFPTPTFGTIEDNATGGFKYKYAEK